MAEPLRIKEKKNGITNGREGNHNDDDGDGGETVGTPGPRLVGMMETGGRGDSGGSQISCGGRRGVGRDIDRRDDGCHGDSTDDIGLDLGGGDCVGDGGSGDSGANGGGFRAALAGTSVKVLQNDSARRRKAAARRARKGRH